MKRMKKSIAFLMTLVLLFCCCTPVLAEENNDDGIMPCFVYIDYIKPTYSIIQSTGLATLSGTMEHSFNGGKGYVYIELQQYTSSGWKGVYDKGAFSSLADPKYAHVQFTYPLVRGATYRLYISAKVYDNNNILRDSGNGYANPNFTWPS